MRRKLVKQGSSTLMLSLPVKWARKLDLRKGDQVDIEERGDTLVVGPATEDAKISTEVIIKDTTESSVRTVVVNAYRTGYDKIILKFPSKKVPTKIIANLQSYILGFEVTHMTKDSCTMENITEPTNEKFGVIVDRIFQNISLLINMTKERLQGEKDTGDYKTICFTIHKYDNFCRRIISKRSLPSIDAHLYWTFLGILIHAQREFYHLNKYLDTKKKLATQNLTFFEAVQKVFTTLHAGHTKQSIALLEKVHSMEKKYIYGDLYNSLNKSGKKEDAITRFHLAMALKHFYLASSPLIGVLLSEKTE